MIVEPWGFDYVERGSGLQQPLANLNVPLTDERFKVHVTGGLRGIVSGLSWLAGS